MTTRTKRVLSVGAALVGAASVIALMASHSRPPAKAPGPAPFERTEFRANTAAPLPPVRHWVAALAPDRPRLPTPLVAAPEPSWTAPVAEEPDQTARAALSWVGVDPSADLYWAAAINDPTLPPEERRDLIEDLNEDGLLDPKHPTPADMPLIASRMRLIETLAPFSMDQVNYDAFQEAYKDLNELMNSHPAQ